MTSLVSSLFPSLFTTSPQLNPIPPASAPEPLHVEEDGFLLVDGDDMVEVRSHASGTGCCEYGHASAGRAPAPVTNTNTQPVSLPAPVSVSPPKRSFAAVAASSSPSLSIATPLCYASPESDGPSLPLKEQVLAAIKQLSAAKRATCSNSCGAECTCKPVTASLSAASQRLYDSSTEWALSIDDPAMKRAKRSAVTTINTTKQTPKKGKGKQAMRRRDKAINRARLDKSIVQ